jgi:hypothetical protein
VNLQAWLVWGFGAGIGFSLALTAARMISEFLGGLLDRRSRDDS